MKLVHAVFESGIFRPTESVDLPDGCAVEFEPRIAAEPDVGHASPDDSSSSSSSSSENWLRLNARRLQLIQKRFTAGLSSDEAQELQELQDLAADHLEAWDSKLLANVDSMRAAVERVVRDARSNP
jgi:predicted DNA-binding antitoxin AbrB/MazE fold protein